MSSVTLESMIERSREFDSKKTDYPIEAKSVFYDGKLFLEQKGDNGIVSAGPYSTTTHSLYQMCGKLGSGTFGKGTKKMLPAEALGLWLNDKDYSLSASDILNAHIERVQPKFFVRTYEDQARAVLSDRYAAVQNTEVLEQVSKALDLLQQQAGKPVQAEVTRSAISPDDLYLRFRVRGMDVLPAGESGPYGLGIFVQNDEIGRGKIKALPSIWRGSCDNTFMVDTTNEAALISRHVGESQLLADRVALAIGHGLKLAGEYLTRFLTAKKVEIPNIFDAISKMAEAEDWSVQFADAVRTGTEGSHTLYGLVNGLTWAAHEVYGENQAEMTTWEIRAGALLQTRTLEPVEL